MERERQRRRKDIEDAYAPVLGPQESLTAELAKLEGQDWKDSDFSKKANFSAKVKELKRQIKALEKNQAERGKAEAEVNEHAEREIAQIHEAAADLLRICSNTEEGDRYFTVGERAEIEENEFNRSLPRYVDTCEPEEEIPLDEAIDDLRKARDIHEAAIRAFEDILERLK